MDTTSHEATKKLQAKLVTGLETLKATQKHLEAFQKDAEASVGLQLKAAKTALKGKRQNAEKNIRKLEELMESKKEETVEAVAEWKARHECQKLEKRAERAEIYADACVTLALHYAGEAELALLEAINARQDAVSARGKSR